MTNKNGNGKSSGGSKNGKGGGMLNLNLNVTVQQAQWLIEALKRTWAVKDEPDFREWGGKVVKVIEGGIGKLEGFNPKETQAMYLIQAKEMLDKGMIDQKTYNQLLEEFGVGGDENEKH